MSHVAFLRAIQAEPDDDTARLVFADWLDDHDQPERAELIRLQVRRAQLAAPLLSITSGCVWKLTPTPREKHLLATFAHEWAGDVPDGIRVEFDRGLLAIDADFRHLRDAMDPGLERLLREGWVEHLILCVDEGDAQELARWPHLACVSQLTLHGHRLGPEGATRLADSPHLAGLRRLHLDTTFILDEGAAALAASPHLSSVKRLRLKQNSIGPDGVAALAASPHLQQLTHLALDNNLFGDEGCRALASSLRLGALRELHLSESYVTGAGARALAQSPNLVRLTDLRLADNGIDADGVRAIVSSPNLTQLMALDLSGICSVREMGELVAALAGSLELPNLTLLALGPWGKRGEPPEAAAVAALAGCPRLAGLTGLSLSNVTIGDEGCRALASSPFLKTLAHLILNLCGIGDEGLRVLTSSATLSALRSLVVDWNQYSESAAQDALRNCRRLDVLLLSHVPEWWADRERSDAGHSPRAVGALVVALDARSAEVRRAALQDLRAVAGHSGSELAGGWPELLRRLLRDPDGPVRRSAVSIAAAVLPFPEAFALLLPSLTDPGVAGDVAQYLRDHAAGYAEKPDFSEDEVAALRAAAGSPEGFVRDCAAGVLAACANPVHLIDVLGAENPDARRAALAALRCRDPLQSAAEGALGHLLEDPEPDIRLNAALALLTRQRVSPESEAMFRQALREGEDGFFDVASSLARAAAWWPGAADVLSEGFSHPDAGARRMVARSLGDVGPPCLRVWGRLVAALSDDDRPVRREILRVLLRVDPAAAVAEPAVSPLLDDPEFRVVIAVTLLQLAPCAAGTAGAELVTELRRKLQSELVADIQKQAAVLGRVAAVKWLRERSGCGLGEAKTLVDAALAQSAGPPGAEYSSP